MSSGIKLVFHLCVPGDGMNAYMAYKVTTKVSYQNIPSSSQQSWESELAVLFLFTYFFSLSHCLSMSLAQTSMVLFKNKDFSVKRRFSDFLGLHSKLASKYLHVGYIVPPAPEKSIVGKNPHLDPEHPVWV